MKFFATVLLVGIATLVAFGFGIFFLYAALALGVLTLGIILWFFDRS